MEVARAGAGRCSTDRGHGWVPISTPQPCFIQLPVLQSPMIPQPGHQATQPPSDCPEPLLDSGSFGESRRSVVGLRGPVESPALQRIWPCSKGSLACPRLLRVHTILMGGPLFRVRLATSERPTM